MKTKRCSKYGKVKPLSEFNKRKNAKDGHSYECKECSRERNKKWRKENPEKLKANTKEWHKKNPDYMKVANEKFQEENPDYKQEWREKHPDYISPCRIENPDYRKEWDKKHPGYVQPSIRENPNYVKEWLEEHPNHTKEWLEEHPGYYNEYMKNKFKTDPMFRLNQYVGNGVYKSLKGNKNGPWLDTVPYTLPMLLERLQEKMIKLNKEYPEKVPMILENYGFIWEIHHRIYQRYWKFEGPEDREFQQCWALCNLMPVWKDEHKRIHKLKLFI